MVAEKGKAVNSRNGLYRPSGGDCLPSLMMTGKKSMKEGQKMKNFYLARVAEARSLDDLDYIVERASQDLDSQADYEAVYGAALDKAQRWRGF